MTQPLVKFTLYSLWPLAAASFAGRWRPRRDGPGPDCGADTRVSPRTPLGVCRPTALKDAGHHGTACCPAGVMPSESPEGAAKSPQRSVSKMTNASGSRRFAVQICLDDFDENRTEPPLLTSPRSLLACGKQGVLPEELVFRPEASFQNRDEPQPKQVVQLRFESYERARKERLRAVRDEYKKLTQPREERSKNSISTQSTPRSLTVEEEEAKMMEAVHKEMEFQRKKQKEEVEAMLLQSFKAQRITAINEAKNAQAAAQLAQLKAQKALKDKEWQEQKAAMLEKKRLEELEEAARQKKLAEEQRQAELALKAKQEAEERERKKAAEAREADMRRKQEELKIKQAAYTAEQQRLAQERKKMMEEKDEERKAVEHEFACLPPPMSASVNVCPHVHTVVYAGEGGAAQTDRRGQRAQTAGDRSENQRRQASAGGLVEGAAGDVCREGAQVPGEARAVRQDAAREAGGAAAAGRGEKPTHAAADGHPRAEGGGEAPGVRASRRRGAGEAAGAAGGAAPGGGAPARRE